MIKIKPSSLGYSIGELREIMYGKMLSKLQYTYAKFNLIILGLLLTLSIMLLCNSKSLSLFLTIKCSIQENVHEIHVYFKG